MKSKLLSLVIPFAFASAMNVASATPLEYYGANHTWLALSETAGLSISDILNGVGGWNQKYRFATDAEVQALLSSFDLAPGFRHDYFGRESAFIWNVGGSMPSGTAGTWFLDGDQGAIGRTSDMVVNVGLVDIDNGAERYGSKCAFGCQFTSITYAPQSVIARSPSVGNFLVEVPEPSSIALVAIAAIALVRTRRKA